MQRLEFDAILNEFNITEKEKDLYYGNIVYLYMNKEIYYEENTTKEDLIKYLIKLEGSNKDSTEVLINVLNKILNKYKVITMRDWLIDDEYSYKYFLGIDKETDPFRREFRKRLEEFDNIFTKHEDITEEVLDEFNIDLGCINKRDNSFHMRITNKYSNNYIEYIRNNEYIGFKILFDKVSVKHYYEINNKNCAEFIYVCTLDKNVKYNISDNKECIFESDKFGNSYEIEKDISMHDYEFIYKKLLDGVTTVLEFMDNLSQNNNLKRIYHQMNINEIN